MSYFLSVLSILCLIFIGYELARIAGFLKCIAEQKAGTSERVNV